MEQNTNHETQTRIPKKEMSDFRKSLLWTTVCTVLLNLIALVGGIIAAIVFHSKGQNEISKGIWTGLGIGISILIIGLGITCFVLIASIE
jgi:ABC-type sugar transport system permease subunit